MKNKKPKNWGNDEELFEQYSLGGIEILYEKLIKDESFSKLYSLKQSQSNLSLEKIILIFKKFLIFTPFNF